MVEGQALKAVWLSLAYAFSVAGLGWLALAIEAHWQQVRGGVVPGRAAVQLLRLLGAAGLMLSLWACLRADHATMAALVWVLTLTAAALTVTFTLSWRPRLLLPLAFWLPATAPDAALTSNSIKDRT